ncbi:ATP-grasp domain-containing protein [Fimbriiglobus ruber]|uniref:ATP-grasp domain-containing protein n=1 Tax=Fimbriiglobus ruber TaxID=1908690 RepID=A0A225DPQ7_9BACT|nr:ATP-grasp domain-containing protein [Fimbriiglobus ruber]OWK39486.1 hypothetical protein FRUB_06049 [Fimbriiglobus ruber]
MTLAIAQYVTSFEALDRQLAYESISDDPENYHRCVARERTLEIEACRQVGIPCFLILDTPETQRIRMIGHGQDQFRRHLLFDSERNPVDSLAGYEVLLRTCVSHEQSPLEFIEAMGGVNVADWASQVKTQEWYKHVRPEYLKRKMAWFPLDQAPDLSGFKVDGQFFAKTSFKAISGVTDSLLSLLGYEVEMMPPGTEIIVSEPIRLPTDARGKREYRCFVVRKISSISRYIDYDTAYEIPGEVEEFATAFIADHQGVLPECYVLDVAESDRGLVVIELNGIVASGRYERNCFRKLLGDLR